MMIGTVGDSPREKTGVQLQPQPTTAADMHLQPPHSIREVQVGESRQNIDGCQRAQSNGAYGVHGDMLSDSWPSEMPPDFQYQDLRNAKTPESYHQLNWDESPDTEDLKYILECENRARRDQSSENRVCEGSERKRRRSFSVRCMPAREMHALPRNLSYFTPNESVLKAMVQAGCPTELHEWQSRCLLEPGVLMGRSIVYSAPTSGGKSLVSEILMVRRAVLTGLPALLVLPFVSICAEKAEHYKKIFSKTELDMDVVELYGQHIGIHIPKKTAIIVSTIERANILINKWMEEGGLNKKLSALCIDELHMVGDADRGYLLELMLTKVIYFSSDLMQQKRINHIQIIGMSATISNLDLLASWLGACKHESSVRPVPLLQYVVDTKGRVLTEAGKEERCIEFRGECPRNENEIVCSLVEESIQHGHSVIVFCASRSSTEKTAESLAKYLAAIPEKSIQKSEGSSLKISIGSPESEVLADEVPTRHVISQVLEYHHESSAETKDLKGRLSHLVARGIAFHHAGLETEEREWVETGFKNGSVSVLCATSTLAAGVNLPARRVIFKHAYTGHPSNRLDAVKYRQMAGRAGRAGLDSMGESYLICGSCTNSSRLLELMTEEVAPISSALKDENHGLSRGMLEAIASQAVRTPSQIQFFIESTLLSRTISNEELAVRTKKALAWLGHEDQRYVLWDEAQNVYHATKQGEAVLSSGLPPDMCAGIIEDLTRAREGLVLESDLHLTYICVPSTEDIYIDWSRYMKVIESLSRIETGIMQRVGVKQGVIQANARGYGTHSSIERRSKGFRNDPHRVYHRFWIALILSDLVQELSLVQIEVKYGVPRGLVQGLQDRASRYCGMLSAFCGRVGWTDLEALLSTFQSRVLHGVLPEMLDLMSIPRVKPYAARLLYRAGLKTPQDVALVKDPGEIVKILSASRGNNKKKKSVSERTLIVHARRVIAEAKMLLRKKAETLQEEAENVLQHIRQ